MSNLSAGIASEWTGNRRSWSRAPSSPRFLFLFGVLAVPFLFNVARYYFLGDDCFISFRYARNLVDGHGLVFNPGERVEGYTNFLWVVLMAGAMKLRVRPELAANALGIASGLAILWVLTRFSLERAERFEPLACIAPCCLAFNRTFTAWSTGGLETQFFSLVLLLASLQFVQERAKGDPRPWASSLLLAVATLTRPDAAIFFMIAGAFLLWEVGVSQRRPLVTLVLWCLPYSAIVGGHLAWRYAYYGYLLPNTFYAKVSGFWWEQSRVYFSSFLRDHSLLPFVPLVLLLFWTSRDFAHRLFGALLAAYAAYLVYVGGDRFEYRFMAPLLPYLYWLLQESVRRAVAGVATRRGIARAARLAALGVAALMIGSAALPSLVPFRPRKGINSLERIADYADRRSEEGKFLRFLVNEGLLTGSELIGVTGAGALPYYSRLPTLDMLGLNDVTVAHSSLNVRGVIGHEKMATEEYIRARRVVVCDALNQLVFEAPPDPKTPRPPWSNCPNRMRCLKAAGKYLVFSTALSDDEFAQTFSRFEVVY